MESTPRIIEVGLATYENDKDILETIQDASYWRYKSEKGNTFLKVAQACTVKLVDDIVDARFKVMLKYFEDF